MKVTVGILAHVDAGKTTLSEQILYHTQAIRKRGRVDHQDAFLDMDKIERRRGITIFSNQALSTYRGHQFFWVDTPGHVDFSAEMERAVDIMDYAMIVISAVEGVQPHTSTVWKLLQRKKVPAFFFINKTDRDGADPSRVFGEIKERLSEDALLFTSHFSDGRMDKELAEQIAEKDDGLLETYLEKGYEKDIWLTFAQKRIAESKLFPCFYGSALSDDGIVPFLDGFCDLLLLKEPHNNLPFCGQVYKIRHDKQGNRLTFLKVLSGSFAVKDSLPVGKDDTGCV